jgi:hypothetical protein
MQPSIAQKHTNNSACIASVMAATDHLEFLLLLVLIGVSRMALDDLLASSVSPRITARLLEWESQNEPWHLRQWWRRSKIPKVEAAFASIKSTYKTNAVASSV